MEETTNKSGMSTGMVVGIAVIVAILFGGGAYAYMNNKATKEKKDLNVQITELQSQVSSATTATPSSSTSTPTATDATVGWKTYTSPASALSSYSISFKYPNTWLTDNSSPSSYFKLYQTSGEKESNYITFDLAGGSGDTSMYGQEISKTNKIIDDVVLSVTEFTKAKFTEHGGIPKTDYFSINSYSSDSSKKASLLTTYDQIVSTFQISKK